MPKAGRAGDDVADEAQFAKFASPWRRKKWALESTTERPNGFHAELRVFGKQSYVTDPLEPTSWPATVPLCVPDKIPLKSAVGVFSYKAVAAAERIIAFWSGVAAAVVRADHQIFSEPGWAYFSLSLPKFRLRLVLRAD